MEESPLSKYNNTVWRIPSNVLLGELVNFLNFWSASYVQLNPRVLDCIVTFGTISNLYNNNSNNNNLSSLSSSSSSNTSVCSPFAACVWFTILYTSHLVSIGAGGTSIPENPLYNMYNEPYISLGSCLARINYLFRWKHQGNLAAGNLRLYHKAFLYIDFYGE